MKLCLSHDWFSLWRVDKHWQLDSLSDDSRGAQMVKVHYQHPLDTQLPDKGFPAGVQQFFSWVDLPGTCTNIWLWEHFGHWHSI